jgi:Mn2+/Fe2+ NRAMP family transporter
VANSVFGWKANMNQIKFKLVWMFILLVGVLFMSLGYKPIEIIKFAQIANGLLLPIIAIFLVWVVNKTSVLGKFKNSLAKNILGLVIIVLTIALGAKSILKVAGLF